MGKSSLAIRIAERLRAEEAAVAQLDLTTLGHTLNTTLSIKQRAELLDEFPGRELPDRLPQQPIDHPTVHLR